MSEGTRNARAGGIVSAVVVLVCTWVTAAAGLAGAVDTSRIVLAEQQWIAAGGYTLVVTPSRLDDASMSLDAARCDRLVEVTGVHGSFAVAATNQTLTPASAPGLTTTLFVVTPGVYRFFWLVPPGDDAGLIVPTPAAERAGFIDGEQTWFRPADPDADGAGPEAGLRAHIRVVDSEILGGDIAGSYLLPTVDLGEAATCYVRTDAAHVDAVAAFLPEAFASDTSPAVAAPRVAPGSYGVEDFSTAFEQRVSRWAWAVAAAVLVLLWALLQRVRRQRLAVYATFGAGPRPRLVLQLAEWGALSVPASVIGAVLATAAGIGAGADVETALVQAPLNVAAAWLAATVGVVSLGLWPIGTVLDSLKDRT